MKVVAPRAPDAAPPASSELSAAADGESLLDVAAAARLLGVPRSWIYAQTRRGPRSLVPFLRVGRYPRFRRGALLQWIEAQTVGGNGATGRGR